MFKHKLKILYCLILLVSVALFAGSLQAQTKDGGGGGGSRPQKTAPSQSSGSRNSESAKRSEIISGILKEIIVESEDSEGHSLYVVDTKNLGLVQVEFRKKNAEDYRNAHVKVKGAFSAEGNFIVDDVLSVQMENIKKVLRPEVEKLDRLGEPIPTRGEVTGPPPTAGPYNVLVIPINFTNDTSQPISPDQIRQILYYNTNSANSYYSSVSKQRFWLKGIQRADIDITNWQTVPHTNQNCNSNLQTNWTNSALAMARVAGFEPDNYGSVMFLFNNVPNCSGAVAFGTLGNLGDDNDNNYIWMRFTNPTSEIFNRIFIHELGHNLGLHHSGAIKNCQTQNLFPQGCDYVEYGDSFTPMGSSIIQLQHFNNFNLYQLGWLNSLGKVASVEQAGTYNLTLRPPAFIDKGYHVITFPLKDANDNLTGQSAYLEFRRPSLPFENLSNIPNQNVTRGVSIRFAPTDTSEVSPTYLFDYHEATTPLTDPAIEIGEIYQNSTYGFTIRTNSTSPQTGAKFTLELTR